MGTDADHWPDDLSLSLGEHIPAHIVPVRKLTPHARVSTSHSVFCARRLSRRPNFLLVPGLPQSSKFHLEQLLGNLKACDAHKAESLGNISNRTTLKHAVVTFMEHNDDQLPYRDLNPRAAYSSQEGETTAWAQHHESLPSQPSSQKKSDTEQISSAKIDIAKHRYIITDAM